METIVSIANRQKMVSTVQAYGTSEGVKKGWDSRSRSVHNTLTKNGWRLSRSEGDTGFYKKAGGRGDIRVRHTGGADSGHWTHVNTTGANQHGTGFNAKDLRQHLKSFGVK